MAIGNEENDLTYIGFNQNFSSLAVGSKNGFKVFKVKTCDGMEIDQEFDWNDVYIFERFFETFMAALVTRRLPKTVVLYNIYENKEMCCFKSSGNILSIRMNSKRLLACCDNALHIYDLGTMKELQVIRDAPSNPSGVTALSPRDVCYMAYPGSAFEGIVRVFDADSLKSISIISAHNSSVAAMTFNSQGTLLATASERGTVIRIFAPETAEKLMEFRRGSLTASIYSLSFSLDSSYLACSSNSRTVHIFRLKDDENREKQSVETQVNSNGWWRYFGDVIQNSASALQNSASYIAGDMLVPLRRSFAVTYLPSACIRNTCAFLNNSKLKVLLVATFDGFLYTYAIDAVNGGECTLLKQQRFSDIESNISSKIQHSDPSSTSGSTNGADFVDQSTGNSVSPHERQSVMSGPVPTAVNVHPEIIEDVMNETCISVEKFEDLAPIESERSSDLTNGGNKILIRSLASGEKSVPTTSASQVDEILPPIAAASANRPADITENVVINHDLTDRSSSSECNLKTTSVSFSVLEEVAHGEVPKDPAVEEGRLVYGPVPKQTYANIVANKRQGDSLDERKAEAEAALRDAVDGDGDDSRKI